jgi:hypothetical protein
MIKRAALLVSALAVLVYTVGVDAQAKPSFAGKWVMDAPAGGGDAARGGGRGRGGRGGRGGFVSGMEVTITQDANTIKIDKMQGQNPVTLTVNLDGSESKNTMQGRGGAIEQTSTAAWEAEKLAISTSFDMGNGAVTTKQTLSLEGGKLVVENFGPDGSPMAKLTYTKGS